MPRGLRGLTALGRIGAAGGGALGRLGLSLAGKRAFSVLPLHEAMRRHIEVALRRVQGRIQGRRGAAALLQINPHTLRARMRKLGIDWSSFREEEA